MAQEVIEKHEKDTATAEQQSATVSNDNVFETLEETKEEEDVLNSSLPLSPNGKNKKFPGVASRTKQEEAVRSSTVNGIDERLDDAGVGEEETVQTETAVVVINDDESTSKITLSAPSMLLFSIFFSDRRFRSSTLQCSFKGRGDQGLKT